MAPPRLFDGNGKMGLPLKVRDGGNTDLARSKTRLRVCYIGVTGWKVG